MGSSTWALQPGGVWPSAAQGERSQLTSENVKKWDRWQCEEWPWQVRSVGQRNQWLGEDDGCWGRPLACDGSWQ
eukprot:7494090-Heterocapsa_arctica.AAC.1